MFSKMSSNYKLVVFQLLQDSDDMWWCHVCRKDFGTTHCTCVPQRTSRSHASWYWNWLRIRVSCNCYILMIRQKLAKLGLVFAWICTWIRLIRMWVFVWCASLLYFCSIWFVSVGFVRSTNHCIVCYMPSMIYCHYSPESIRANHGFTLWAKRTAFTWSAILPPKVNRFGCHLE